MKMVLLSLFILMTSQSSPTQKVYTKNGNISFFSKSPLENITANNNQVMSVLNLQNGEMQFSVLVKGFNFNKSLMEEHFNENYMESDKYPKAIFKGNITNISKIDLTKDYKYNITVSGDITIHGTTKKISAPGTISVKEGKVTGKSNFKLRLSDYNIRIPKLVRNNIAEVIEIFVSCDYDQKL